MQAVWETPPGKLRTYFVCPKSVKFRSKFITRGTKVHSPTTSYYANARARKLATPRVVARGAVSYTG